MCTLAHVQGKYCFTKTFSEIKHKCYRERCEGLNNKGMLFLTPHIAPLGKTRLYFRALFDKG